MGNGDSVGKCENVFVFGRGADKKPLLKAPSESRLFCGDAPKWPKKRVLRVPEKPLMSLIAAYTADPSLQMRKRFRIWSSRYYFLQIKRWHKKFNPNLQNWVDTIS